MTTVGVGRSMKKIVSAYKDKRIFWMMNWLRKNYLKEFYDELTAAADASESKELSKLERLVSCIRTFGAG